MGRLKRLNGFAGSFSNWAGTIAALSVIFGWISGWLPTIGRPLAWSERFFIGVGSALLTMLVLSVSLASWRFFRPISPTLPAAALAASTIDINQLSLTAHLTKERLDELLAKLAIEEQHVKNALAHAQGGAFAVVAKTRQVGLVTIRSKLISQWDLFNPQINLTPNFTNWPSAVQGFDEVIDKIKKEIATTDYGFELTIDTPSFNENPFRSVPGEPNNPYSQEWLHDYRKRYEMFNLSLRQIDSAIVTSEMMIRATSLPAVISHPDLPDTVKERLR